MRGIPLPAVRRVSLTQLMRKYGYRGDGKEFAAYLCVELPEHTRVAVWNLLKKAHEKFGDMVKLILDVPMRKRSTGKNSQNAHINGHCQQIAVETGNDFTVVKESMKDMALSRGYPIAGYVLSGPRKGTPIPKSEADITVDEAKILIDTIHQWADEWFFVLIEVADEEAA
jgi:hypothetical protein